MVVMDNKEFLNLINFTRNKQTHLCQLELHLADHCNLNCRSCDHYSPISEECFPAFEKVSSDMKKLSEITNANIDNILLLGGEPLLNKDIEKYVVMVRDLFPNSNIQIVTNGILLKKQSEEFYDCCDKEVEKVLEEYQNGIDIIKNNFR